MKKQTKSIKKNSKSSSRFMRWASGGFANPQSRMIAVIVIIMLVQDQLKPSLAAPSVVF